MPPTTVPTVAPSNPANSGAPTTPPNNSGGSNNNSVRQPTLGQPMPPIPTNSPRLVAPTRAIGNAVTFKVSAKPGATVNIYRNGILVSSVPAAAAAALKVTDNPAGENSFQVVVVEQSGKISVSEKSTVATGPVTGSKNATSPQKKSPANGKAVVPKKNAPQSKASTSKDSK
ncbi:MAG: hypothetical protein EBS27_03975 [Actinobacteria bacterium]|nr:hypothetical protein [Actinomycetota bacterium]